MLGVELALVIWMAVLGASVVSLIGFSATGFRGPAILVSPLVGLVASGLLGAVLAAAGVPRWPWWMSAGGVVITTGSLIGAWRARRVAAWFVDVVAAAASGAAGVLALYPLMGPVLTFDSYRFVMLGRALRGAELDYSQPGPADFPVLIMHVQALARSLRAEYSVYAAGVAAALALVAAVMIACHSISDRTARVRVVVGATAVLAAATGSTYMLRMQLTYLNSHLVAAALYATAVASVVALATVPASHPARRSLLLLFSVCLGGYAIVRLEGLLVVTLLVVFAVGAVDLTRRESIELAVVALVAPAIWYGNLVRLGSAGDVVSAPTIIVSMLLPCAALGLASAPRRSPLRRLIDPRLAVLVLLAGVVVQVLLNRPHAPVSLSAQWSNSFVVGGWGVFWWAATAFAVAVMATSVSDRSGDPPDGGDRPAVRWSAPILGYVLLVTLLGTVREMPYRLGWGDSGNRMLVHVVPTIVIAGTLWTVQRSASGHRVGRAPEAHDGSDRRSARGLGTGDALLTRAGRRPCVVLTLVALSMATACSDPAASPSPTTPAPTMRASTVATTATTALPVSYEWPDEVWFGSAGVGRDDFVDDELEALLGDAGVELAVATAPVVADDGVFHYRNPVGEDVPVRVRAPGGDEWTGPLADADPGLGLVIALHQTNDVGGAEPCGPDDTPLSYGTFFATQGYLVVCPTLSFTGERQLEAHWDTTAFYDRYPGWSAMGKDISEVGWLLDALDTAAVDVEDVMVIGHSQGSIYGLFAAALDERIDRVIANAGFVDTATDPDPGRWSRDSWYRAFPEPPEGLDYLEVIAAIAPRCALLINYDADAILVATAPEPAALSDFESRFASIDWLAATGPHDWKQPQLVTAADWARRTSEVCG